MSNNVFATLDAFNGQFPNRGKPGQKEIIGNWAIFFTGLKGAQEDDCVAGQWIAWAANVVDRVQGRSFYVCVPGLGGGEYQKGECFDMTPSTESLRLGDFLTERGSPGWQRATRLVIAGRERLLQLLRDQGLLELAT